MTVETKTTEELLKERLLTICPEANEFTELDGFCEYIHLELLLLNADVSLEQPRVQELTFWYTVLVSYHKHTFALSWQIASRHLTLLNARERELMAQLRRTGRLFARRHIGSFLRDTAA